MVIFRVVRQRSFGKAEGTTFAIDVLIAHGEEDLGEVYLWAFGFGFDYFVDVVGFEWREGGYQLLDVIEFVI
jgi:hypothetical protein